MFCYFFCFGWFGFFFYFRSFWYRERAKNKKFSIFGGIYDYLLLLATSAVLYMYIGLSASSLACATIKQYFFCKPKKKYLWSVKFRCVIFWSYKFQAYFKLLIRHLVAYLPLDKKCHENVSIIFFYSLSVCCRHFFVVAAGVQKSNGFSDVVETFSFFFFFSSIDAVVQKNQQPSYRFGLRCRFI